MTLPPSLSELDSEREADQDLTRVSVLVGGLLVDVGLPAHERIDDVVLDVIDLASDQLLVQRPEGDVEFDNTVGRWTLARLGGEPIDPVRSLAEANVYDGDVLVVHPAGVPAASVLFDDVEVKTGGDDRRRRVAEYGRMAAWFGLAFFLAVVTAVMLPSVPALPQAPEIPVAAIAAIVSGIGLAVAACLVPRRNGDGWKSAAVAAVAVPLIFGAALQIVPGGHGVTALPMAFGLIALVALLALLVSGRGRALYTGVITCAVLCTPAAAAELLWQLNARSIGAVLATVAVIVVYVAPRATIMLSKLPVPRVPTAGEPLDDIETQGGTTVEGVNAIGKQVIPTEAGLAERVKRANEYLTGIIGAAALTAVVGTVLAVDVSAGFFWQGTAFAVTVATVLCLRGRGHYDLVQSASLIGGGLAIALATIVKTATYLDGWQVNAALMLVVLTIIAMATGLVATRMEFSPVMRRWVELSEYLAVALVFPLACWIIRLYAFFRELRI